MLDLMGSQPVMILKIQKYFWISLEVNSKLSRRNKNVFLDQKLTRQMIKSRLINKVMHIKYQNDKIFLSENQFQPIWKYSKTSNSGKEKEQKSKEDQETLSSKKNSLIYLMCGTRPDPSSRVGYLTRSLKIPSEAYIVSMDEQSKLFS